MNERHSTRVVRALAGAAVAVFLVAGAVFGANALSAPPTTIPLDLSLSGATVHTTEATNPPSTETAEPTGTPEATETAEPTETAEATEAPKAIQAPETAKPTETPE